MPSVVILNVVSSFLVSSLHLFPQFSLYLSNIYLCFSHVSPSLSFSISFIPLFPFSLSLYILLLLSDSVFNSFSFSFFVSLSQSPLCSFYPLHFFLFSLPLFSPPISLCFFHIHYIFLLLHYLFLFILSLFLFLSLSLYVFVFVYKC
jgi:hypothetical protein